MPKHAPQRAKTSARALFIALGAAAAVLAAVLSAYKLQVLTAAGFLATCADLWQYHESPAVLAFMQQQWQTWPEVQAQQIPELPAENFTREAFWEVTNNLRRPVIIRGALQNTTAVNEWGQDFFVRHYPDALVVVRHSIGDNDFRIVRVPMKDFWKAFDQGLNVTIFTSSSIFAQRPELKQQMAAPFEEDFVDKSGHGIFVSQMFVTPGGRYAGVV